MIRIALFLLFAVSLNLDALGLRGPHSFSVGPEAYYVVRTRQGGTQQHGTICGVSAKYERFRRCALYWALQYDGGWGELNGHDSNNNNIRSSFSEQQLEGRFGYNYQWKTGYKPYILPFIGYGYYNLSNDFIHPSPTRVKLVDHFPYSAGGIQVGMNVTPCWTVGFLFKADWMLEGNSKLEGVRNVSLENVDLEGKDTVEMDMEAHWQYDFELPITYRRKLGRRTLYYMFTPFIKIRHFGGLPGYPFDFIDTRYRDYGARLVLGYDF